MNQIRAEIEKSDSDYDREKLQERLAKLAGGVAVIKVGAATEVELKERKHRIEDAVRNAKAAVEEGLLPGGGVALANAAATAFDKLDLVGDEATGANIVRVALTAPLKQIAINAGLEGGVVAEKVSTLEPGHGLNAATGEYVDMFKEGIVEPAKVTRSALQNAASIAALFLTTEAVVADKPEKAPAGAAGRHARRRHGLLSPAEPQRTAPAHCAGAVPLFRSCPRNPPRRAARREDNSVGSGGGPDVRELVRAALVDPLLARGDGGVRVVGEHPVHAERVEQLVLAERVAVVGRDVAAVEVRRQEVVLVAEGVRRDLQSRRGARCRRAWSAARCGRCCRAGRSAPCPVRGRSRTARCSAARSEWSGRRTCAGRRSATKSAGAPRRGRELEQRQVGAAVQPLQVAHLEGLDDHRQLRVVPVRPLRASTFRTRCSIGSPIERKYVECLISGMMPIVRWYLRDERLGLVDVVLQRLDPVPAVVDRVVLPDVGQPLLRVQGLQLGQREVGREPAGGRDAVDRPGRAAVGELRVLRDVGRLGDVRLVPVDEEAVLGRDEVGLEVVGAHAGGELRSPARGVLRPVPGGAAVAEDERDGRGGRRARGVCRGQRRTR